jgi:redox-sensitive bicupin YhaK (pirin superfamily)
LSTKSIEKIINPPPYHWVGDGFKVHTFFPSSEIDRARMSPFFLLDYNAKMKLEPSKVQRGVGPHPHRGLETVTVSYHGKIAHHDSLGNGGIIEEGDVQWMTAGAGILHKEYHEKEFSKSGGLFQMVQLWVNLPKKDKFAQPNYQNLISTKMGKIELPNNGGSINIIAGKMDHTSGPATFFTPLHLYDIKLNKGNNLKLSFPKDYNTGMLLLEGNIQINDDEIAQTDQFVLFQNDGESFTISAQEDSSILLMSGEPINEPIYPYGPFLMNTKSEIVEAIEDYNSGKFGHLD